MMNKVVLTFGCYIKFKLRVIEAVLSCDTALIIDTIALISVIS